MSALDRAVLEITTDVDNDGSVETGVFEMVGNVAVTEQVEPDYWFNGVGGQANAVIQGILGSEEFRKSIFLDLGSGSHIFEIQFLGWEGAVDGNGNDVQWGNTGDPSTLTEGDATGAEPLQQMQVFNRYLIHARMDSIFGDATLHIGEYSDGTYGDNGLFDPVLVAIATPTGSFQTQDYSTWDGRLTAIEVLDLTRAIDAKEQLDY